MINQFLFLIRDQFLVRDSLDVLRFGIEGLCNTTDNTLDNISISLGYKGPCLFKREHFNFIALRIVGTVGGLNDSGSRAQYPYQDDLKRRKRMKRTLLDPITAANIFRRIFWLEIVIFVSTPILFSIRKSLAFRLLNDPRTCWMNIELTFTSVHPPDCHPVQTIYLAHLREMQVNLC